MSDSDKIAIEAAKKEEAAEKAKLAMKLNAKAKELKKDVKHKLDGKADPLKGAKKAKAEKAAVAAMESHLVQNKTGSDI